MENISLLQTYITLSKKAEKSTELLLKTVDNNIPITNIHIKRYSKGLGIVNVKLKHIRPDGYIVVYNAKYNGVSPIHYLQLTPRSMFKVLDNIGVKI